MFSKSLGEQSRKAGDQFFYVAERLVNPIAVLCILSWRAFWITMINRTAPDAPPELAFTQLELYLLDQLV